MVPQSGISYVCSAAELLLETGLPGNANYSENTEVTGS